MDSVLALEGVRARLTSGAVERAGVDDVVRGCRASSWAGEYAASAREGLMPEIDGGREYLAVDARALLATSKFPRG